MNIRSVFVLLFAFSSIPASASPKQEHRATRERCSLGRDELAVLTSYLKWSTGKTATILVAATDTSQIDLDSVNLQLAVKGLGIPADARQDLKLKTQQSCSIANPHVRNVMLIPKAEHDAMFQKRAGWREFHSRYGKNARLELLSRVGFSADKRIAVFYASGGVGAMAGSCYLYVFELNNGQWVKKADAPAWAT